VGLGRFFRFLVDERLIVENPMRFVEITRAPKVRVRPLSADQVRELLAQVYAKSFRGVRDRALMILAWDSGLRLSEIIGIRLAAWNCRRAASA
jgi:integrase/recombinase XerD